MNTSSFGAPTAATSRLRAQPTVVVTANAGRATQESWTAVMLARLMASRWAPVGTTVPLGTTSSQCEVRAGAAGASVVWAWMALEETRVPRAAAVRSERVVI